MSNDHNMRENDPWFPPSLGEGCSMCPLLGSLLDIGARYNQRPMMGIPVFLFSDREPAGSTLVIEGVEVLHLQIIDFHGIKGIDLVAYLSCINSEDPDPLCAISMGPPEVGESSPTTCLHLYDGCVSLGYHPDLDTAVGFMVHTLALSWLLAPEIMEYDSSPGAVLHPAFLTDNPRHALYSGVRNAYEIMDGKQYSGILEREMISEKIFVPHWGRIFATLCEHWHSHKESKDINIWICRIIDEQLRHGIDY